MYRFAFSVGGGRQNGDQMRNLSADGHYRRESVYFTEVDIAFGT